MPGKHGFGDTRKKSSQSPAYKKSSAFKMKGWSPLRQERQKTGTLKAEKTDIKRQGTTIQKTGTEKKGNIPYPNLKTHADGTYSYTTPDGTITLTKSEYNSAKASNAKAGY